MKLSLFEPNWGIFENEIVRERLVASAAYGSFGQIHDLLKSLLRFHGRLEDEVYDLYLIGVVQG